MFGALLRGGAALLRGSVTAGRAVANTSVIKSAVKQTALGTAIYAAGNAISGSNKSGGLPALPGGGFPALPTAPGMGSRGIFSNDANVPAMLKEWTISKGDLKFYPRAPRGFVICYDEKGDPFAIPKKIAMMLKLWRPAKKPPISVGDWQAVKRADRTVSKMKKIFSVTTRVDKNISGGKVKVRRSKGGK